MERGYNSSFNSPTAPHSGGEPYCEINPPPRLQRFKRKGAPGVKIQQKASCRKCTDVSFTKYWPPEFLTCLRGGCTIRQMHIPHSRKSRVPELRNPILAEIQNSKCPSYGITGIQTSKIDGIRKSRTPQLQQSGAQDRINRERYGHRIA